MQWSRLLELLCQIQRRSSTATLTTWLAVRQMEVMVAEWPVSLCWQVPDCKSHRRTLASTDPLAATPPHCNITLASSNNSVIPLLNHISSLGTEYWASRSSAVLAYSQTFTDAHCTYSQMDGQWYTQCHNTTVALLTNNIWAFSNKCNVQSIPHKTWHSGTYKIPARTINSDKSR